jgi:hypothetical protein
MPWPGSWPFQDFEIAERYLQRKALLHRRKRNDDPALVAHLGHRAFNSGKNAFADSNPCSYRDALMGPQEQSAG